MKEIFKKIKRIFLKEEKIVAEEIGEIVGKIEYEETKLASFGYSTIRAILSPIVKGLWIHQIEGIENIPKTGACIIACNHESYFDFICFIAASPRKIHYLAAEKFFTNKFWLPLMKLTGQIRVDRQAKEKNATHNYVYSALRQHRMIGIFPEGTRSMDGNIHKAYTGVAKFALKARVPIIPVGLIGTREILAKHQKIPTLKKARVIIGKPIYLDEHYDKEHDEILLREVTDTVMHKIAGLVGKEYKPVDKIENK